MGSMKEKRKNQVQPPFAAETKDVRFAGTFEVLVPVPGRNKPHRAASQFPSQHAAEGWLHSDEGKDSVAEILRDAEKPHNA